MDKLHQSCHTFCFRLLLKYSRKIPLRWVTVAAAVVAFIGVTFRRAPVVGVDLVTRFCGGPLDSGSSVFALNGEIRSIDIHIKY